jgi:hypothetical protein
MGDRHQCHGGPPAQVARVGEAGLQLQTVFRVVDPANPTFGCGAWRGRGFLARLFRRR